jgi:hypothetical protein
LGVNFLLFVESVFGVRFFRKPDCFAGFDRLRELLVETVEREAGLVDLGDEAAVDGVSGC